MEPAVWRVRSFDTFQPQKPPDIRGHALYKGISLQGIPPQYIQQVLRFQETAKIPPCRGREGCFWFGCVLCSHPLVSTLLASIGSSQLLIRSDRCLVLLDLRDLFIHVDSIQGPGFATTRE